MNPPEHEEMCDYWETESCDCATGGFGYAGATWLGYEHGLRQREAEVASLRALLRRLTEAVAPAVAVLSRSLGVAPDIRDELANAESLILGEVARALAPGKETP